MSAPREFSVGPWREVRPGVHVATCEPESVNVGLVVGADACLLIESGSSAEHGAAIRASISEVTSLPLRTVVVTHHHVDHAHGLDAFADVETMAHENAAAVLRDAGKTPPSIALSLLAARDLGGVHVEISYVGPAHTQGDLVVLVPAPRVLFVGDMVEESGPPSIEDDSSLATWTAALDAVISLTKHDTLIVPGHGEVIDKWFVAHQQAGISALWGQPEWLVQQGVSEADAYAHDDLQWPWDEATARRGIAQAYRELAAKGVIPRRQLPLAPKS